MWSYFSYMLRCMLWVMNVAFRDLDCVERSSNPRFELKLYKALMWRMDQILACVGIRWPYSKFLGLSHIRN